MCNIKFRAWDKLEKRMRKVVSLHWRDNKLVSAKLGGDNEPIPVNGRLAISWCTGAIDTKAKDIFQDDWILYRKHIYLVIFDGVAFRVTDINDLSKSTAKLLSDIYSSECEVVGNLYTGSRLLEEK